MSPTEESISEYGRNKGSEIAATAFYTVMQITQGQHLKLIAADMAVSFWMSMEQASRHYQETARIMLIQTEAMRTSRTWTL